jgi:hypothetical protein
VSELKQKLPVVSAIKLLIFEEAKKAAAFLLATLSGLGPM